MDRLCGRLQVEKDLNVFNKLVEEMYELLEAKHERLQPKNRNTGVITHLGEVELDSEFIRLARAVTSAKDALEKARASEKRDSKREQELERAVQDRMNALVKYCARPN